VERVGDVAVGDEQGPGDAVVDVGEAPGLVAVAPDLDGVPTGQLGGGHLAADGRRRLLPPAVVGAVGAVDVVVAGDPGGDPGVLGRGRVGVLLGEPVDVRPVLLAGGVDAGGGGVEVALDPLVPGRHQQVRVDEHAQHAGRLVALDEADAAHVGGEVEDL